MSKIALILYEEILAVTGGVFSPGASVTILRHRIRSLARQLEMRMLVIERSSAASAVGSRED
jgi:hypothetical protein